MDNQQITRDLTVAKLCGSNLPTNKLVEQYRQYYEEINDYIKYQIKSNAVKVIQNPFR